ncbi:MAG: hypothetical protein VKI83_03060 [Synechococcaceae cyanobacterium]|nr:hypothetical protein [Synechococcaceae cyanobacterium]
MAKPNLTGDQDRLFNNADSFAQVFDPAWQAHCRQQPDLEPPQRLELIVRQLADHPFVQSDPERARQVAGFRIRLLGL